MAEIEQNAAAEAAAATPEPEIRACLFSIGEDTYALPVEMLLEVIIPQKIFPVPTTPSHVLGVINLRGSIVPIIDVRTTFALQPQSAAEGRAPGQIVIIRHGHTVLGIVVDKVLDVLSIPESSLLELPPERALQRGTGNRNRFFKSVIQRGEGAAALIDVEALFDAAKLA